MGGTLRKFTGSQASGQQHNPHGNEPRTGRSCPTESEMPSTSARGRSTSEGLAGAQTNRADRWHYHECCVIKNGPKMYVASCNRQLQNKTMDIQDANFGLSSKTWKTVLLPKGLSSFWQLSIQLCPTSEAAKEVDPNENLYEVGVGTQTALVPGSHEGYEGCTKAVFGQHCHMLSLLPSLLYEKWTSEQCTPTICLVYFFYLDVSSRALYVFDLSDDTVAPMGEVSVDTSQDLMPLVLVNSEVRDLIVSVKALDANRNTKKFLIDKAVEYIKKKA